jgi:Uma2 family endonuclease
MMQPMKAVHPTLTYPELRLMPDDGKRYELIDGEVFVSPSPSEKQQRASGRLYVSWAVYVEKNDLGRVYYAPFDVVFGEKTALQPDLLFVSKARLGIIGPEYIIGAPDLWGRFFPPAGRPLIESPSWSSMPFTAWAGTGSWTRWPKAWRFMC